MELSRDQKPYRQDERARIVKNGGWIDDSGLLNGYISMTRAFGDIGLKTFKTLMFPNRNMTDDVFICEPEIIQVEISSKDEFLILASDGLWGRISSKRAVKIARDSLRKHGDPQHAAEDLVDAAYREGSQDNCTVLVVIINTLGLQYSGASLTGSTVGPAAIGNHVHPPVAEQRRPSQSQESGQDSPTTLIEHDPHMITNIMFREGRSVHA
eukprot:CAMPEP_0184662598 /NCGR_PEP_ID=MMETSP0308-20130426/44002_1 /TAXON_ID=38269 /ORGANISM="Gloeochaete witrockiana, Strain SAG 46.84" /LENGTH=210 /DNA_ID=CAMNT_0027104745 /DNA_START=131 /DNA_END=760 /DNA_ORIENTATION=-